MSRKAFFRLLIPTLLCALTSLPAWSDSQVRIVRLSYIDGGVQIDRGTGHNENAIVNLPITQGMKLRTKDDGRAEVEFEDGSTLRLAPATTAQFAQLSLRDSGEKVSTITVVSGTVYADVAGSKNNDLTLQFGRERTTLTRPARIRIGIDDNGASVAVLKGADIQIDSPSGTVEARRGQTADFDFSKDDQFTLAKSIQQYPYDEWDKHQDQFHQRYASNSYSTYSPYAYGTADLAYYGNFFSAPGYGMLWRPYFVGMGWDPFMDGAWAFAPGWGFGWVSAYPWGWVPYHYGTWLFVPGFGWAWEPGGVWMPWYSTPVLVNAPKGFTPPRAPIAGTSTVVVNRGPVAIAKPGLFGSKLVIQNNSAGLGVPRGGVENLSKVSQRVEERGTVTQRVSTAPPPEMGVPMGGPSHGSMGNTGSPRVGSPSPRMSAPEPRMEPQHSSSPAPAPPSPHR